MTSDSTNRSLHVTSLHLVGASRRVHFQPGFSVVKGSITTGKTTLVRLIRGLLGRVPDHLPPETARIQSLRGRLEIAGETWVVTRPMTSTKTAMVELSRRQASVDSADVGEARLGDESEERIVETLRLPAEVSTAAEERTYQSWMLSRLGLPEVSVPRARTDAASAQSPVTINDWLNYCIIRDDEIDTAVFGHKNDWIDRKRRAVFELVYGIYDADTAALQGQLRATELQLEHLDQASEIIREFVKDTEIDSLEAVDLRIADLQDQLEELDAQARSVATTALAETRSVGLRRELAEAEKSLADANRRVDALERSRDELVDLQATLRKQSDRLTRAIVANEWLVDFDFIVCPRCGSEVNQERIDHTHCYLCLQEPSTGDAHDELVLEQERVASQIEETSEIIGRRGNELREADALVQSIRSRLSELNAELERRTAEFISARSEALALHAERRAERQAELRERWRYRDLLAKFADSEGMRATLEERRAELQDALSLKSTRSARTELLLEALEQRFQEYVSRLNLTLSGLPATATINRNTYLPEIDRRPFDELSSQGLSVLVNVAHALAHHTVAIDHELPLPGLLVLDGVSNNVGHEGFDLARRDDMYQLLIDEVTAFSDHLQVIVFDNDIPDFATPHLALTLEPDDRLIRLEDARVEPSRESETSNEGS